MAFERVYTVSHWYDGPREGLADYHGQPHHYVCEWDSAGEDHAETYRLKSIDQETLAMALEQWEIWREWELSFHRGEVEEKTHPALPGQHPHYAELDALLKSRLAANRNSATRCRAVFRVIAGSETYPAGVMRPLEVEWWDAI